TFSNSDFIEKVAGINRNGWPLSIRISGRFESESMATLDRNIQIVILQQLLRNMIVKYLHLMFILMRFKNLLRLI
ncbi:MAG: hypothetical protein AB1410_03805, partial [Acidobacteriota bacterium]